MSSAPSALSPSTKTWEPNWLNIQATSQFSLVAALLLLSLLRNQKLDANQKMVFSVSIVVLLFYGLAVSSLARLKIKKDAEKGALDANEWWLLIISIVGGVLVAVGAGVLLSGTSDDPMKLVNLDNTWGIWLGVTLWLLPLSIDTFMY